MKIFSSELFFTFLQSGKPNVSLHITDDDYYDDDDDDNDNDDDVHKICALKFLK